MTMKTYLFIFLVACAAIFFSYGAGVRVGRAKCNAQTEHNVAIQQSEIIKTMESVNAETFNTGVRDIRRILHEKYTIAE